MAARQTLFHRHRSAISAWRETADLSRMRIFFGIVSAFRHSRRRRHDRLERAALHLLLFLRGLHAHRSWSLALADRAGVGGGALFCRPRALERGDERQPWLM